MKKTILVNKNCKINFENPTPVKQDMAVVINIETLKEAEGFLNFLILANENSNGMEIFGYTTNIKESENIFIKTITINSEIPTELRNRLLIEDLHFYPSTDFDQIYYFFVRIETDNEDFFVIVCNEHNGYYSHAIFYTDDVYKVVTSDDDLNVLMV
jgi:hypothetical protein